MRGRLLLVDDDPDVLVALESLLGGTYDVVAAEDGDDALNHLRARDFDVVLLDLMMPRTNGATVLNVMKAGGMSVPVILASASVDLAERARELGAEDNIQKPYDVDLLEWKIAKLLEQRRDAGATRPSGSGAPSPRAPAE